MMLCSIQHGQLASESFAWRPREACPQDGKTLVRGGQTLQLLQGVAGAWTMQD